MTDAQQREAERQFYYKWNGKGKEDEDARSYLINTLVNVFGMENVTDLFPDVSLADLYDPLTMPPELRKAHALNDRAVMQAYGMPIKETDEAKCVAWLMRLYQEKVAELENGKK